MTEVYGIYYKSSHICSEARYIALAPSRMRLLRKGNSRNFSVWRLFCCVWGTYCVQQCFLCRWNSVGPACVTHSHPSTWLMSAWWYFPLMDVRVRCGFHKYWFLGLCTHGNTFEKIPMRVSHSHGHDLHMYNKKIITKSSLKVQLRSEKWLIDICC